MKRPFRIFSYLGLLAALCGWAQAALVLHYPLNEGSGTAAADAAAASAGAPAAGALKGAGSGWVADAPSGSGSAYALDTRGGYITAGTVAKLEGLSAFTITGWMKFGQIAYNDRILSTRSKDFASDPSSGFIDLMADSQSSNKELGLRLEFRNGEQQGVSVRTETFDASNWVFVGIVREGRKVTFYLGDTRASDPLQVLPSSGRVSGISGVNANSGEFRLAGTAAGSRNRSPQGAFSDVRIYDEALTPTALNAVRLEALGGQGGSAGSGVSAAAAGSATAHGTAAAPSANAAATVPSGAVSAAAANASEAGSWDTVYTFSAQADAAALRSGSAEVRNVGQAYDAGRGYGFIFAQDSGVTGNGRVLFRQREQDGQTRSVAIDARNYGKPALDRPPYTVRIDLPNGWYRVGVAGGDPAGSSALMAHVGDALVQQDGVAFLDETADNTLSLFDGSEALTKGSLLVKDIPFEVTEGYMLVSFRRPPQSRSRWGSLAGIGVERIERSGADAAAVLWLVRQGRFVPQPDVVFDGPSADFIRSQWEELTQTLTQSPYAAAATGESAVAGGVASAAAASPVSASASAAGANAPWMLSFRLASDAVAAAELANAQIAAESLGKDGFALIPVAGGLSAVANSPYGLISALYEVIRLGTGFEWVRPMADRPLVPVRQAYLELEAPLVVRPAFELRGQALTQYDASREYPVYWNWLVRNGYNMVGGSLIGERFRVAERLNTERDMVHNFFGHTLHALVPTETFFESNPEYFPIVDGKRKGGYKGAQVNMANAEVVDVVVAAFERYMQRDPALDIVSMGTNDTGDDGRSGWGEGEDELAQDDPRDLQQANMRDTRSYATRYVRFANAVAEKFAQKYPDVTISIYAYHETLPAPYVTPHKNLLIQFSPLYKSMNQSMNSTSSGRNRQFNAWLQDWAKLTDNILMRDYYVMFSRVGRSVLPVSLYVVKTDLQYYRDLGLRGIAPEMIPDGPNGGNVDLSKPYPPFVKDPNAYVEYWDSSWLVHYGLGRLMWNPDVSVRELIENACRIYYGPASPWMAEYHDRLNHYLYKSGRPDVVLAESDIQKSYGGRVHTGPYDRTWNWLPVMREQATALFDLKELEPDAAKERLLELATLLAHARETARKSGLRLSIERVERDIAQFDLYTASLGYGFEFRRGRTEPRILALPGS